MGRPARRPWPWRWVGAVALSWCSEVAADQPLPLAIALTTDNYPVLSWPTVSNAPVGIAACSNLTGATWTLLSMQRMPRDREDGVTRSRDTLFSEPFLCYRLTVPGPSSAASFGVLPPNGTSLATIRDQLGAGYYRFKIQWADLEPQPGVYDFTNLDQRLSRLEAEGLRALPSLCVGRGWMNHRQPVPPGSPEPQSFPPDDLTTNWNTQFGYSSNYYFFLTRFMQRYPKRFDGLVIEIEENSSLFWGGGVVNTNGDMDPFLSAAEYVRLLKTAYKAIKEQDPAVMVTDGGMVSEMWGVVMARDWWGRGATSLAAAVDFAYQYCSYGLPTSSVPTWATPAALAYAITNQASPLNTNTWVKANTLLDGFSGALDQVNFHYYQSFRWLPTLTDWIRERMLRAPQPYLVPLLCNELGLCGVADLGCEPEPAFSAAELDRQAREVFKNLVLSRVADLRCTIWFSVDTVCIEDKDKVGLFSSATTLRPGGLVYSNVVRQFARGVIWTGSAAAGSNLFHYTMANPSNQPVLEAIWTEYTNAVVTLAAPAGCSNAVMTDYLGNDSSRLLPDGWLTWTASAPVFIQWQ